MVEVKKRFQKIPVFRTHLSLQLTFLRTRKAEGRFFALVALEATGVPLRPEK